MLKAAQHIARDGKLERFRQSHIWLHIYNVQIHQSKISKHFIRVKLCSYQGCSPTDLRGAERNQCQVLANPPAVVFSRVVTHKQLSSLETRNFIWL